MLLITGPTGNTGRELVSLLRDQSTPFRCLTRRPEAADALRAQGLDVVHGDFDDRESLAQALDGVRRAFLVCTPDEKMIERETAFIDAAREAGVERVVKISAYSAADDSESPNLRAHAAIERHLQESGLDYTILRPHAFMQTMFWMSVPMLHQAGVISAAVGQGAAPHVDLRDVALVALDALSSDDPAHRRAVHELTGPEAVTMAEIAEMLVPIAGKPVAYVPSPEEPVADAMRSMGVAEPSIEHVLVVSRKIAAGEFATVHSTLADLGVAPRTWRDFLDDVQAGRTGGATSFEARPGASGGPPPGGPPPGGPPPGGPPPPTA